MATDRKSVDRGVRALVAALKLAKPFSCTAVTAEGDETQLALIGERGRYERVARSAFALNAVQLRCLDADGRVTETIGIDGTTTTDDTLHANQAAKVERSRDAELRQLFALMNEQTDRVSQRYEGMFKLQADQSKQLTEAAIGVMRVAADRSAKLEGAVLRLVSVREREISERERELARAVRQLTRSEDDEDDEPEDESAFDDPNIQKLIKIAGRAVGIPDDEPPKQ